MILELPESLEAALKMQANAHGVSPGGYVRQILQRDLSAYDDLETRATPFLSGRGMFAKYGKAPSVGEIEDNRAEMFKGFGEGLD